MSREWESSALEDGSVITANLGGLPVIDPLALARFRDEIGDERALRRFLGSFVSLLPGRIRSLRAAAEIGDRETVLLRAESISVGAEMTGARRLGHAASEVAALARRGAVPSTEHIAALATEASRTTRELRNHAEPFSA